MSELTTLINELSETKPGFKDAQAAVRAIHGVGDMLERMRNRAGLSQGELGKRLGVSPARVSQLESGTLRDAPSLKMLLRFAQACGETIAIEASGERDAAGDASQDAPAQDDRWNALTSELAAMRAETAQLRQTVAAQTNSDPVHAELAKLRDEIVNLRDTILGTPMISPFLKRGDKVHVFGMGIHEAQPPHLPHGDPSPPTLHGNYLMGSINEVTLYGCEMAMQSVLTAAGCHVADVNVAKPRVTKDGLAFTMTIK